MFELSSIQFNSFAKSVFGFYGKISSQGALNEIEGDLLNSLEIDTELLVGQMFSELIIWQTDDANIEKLQDALKKAKNGENSKISLKFRQNAKEAKIIDLNFVTNLIKESEEIFFFVSDVSELHCELNLYKERCDHFLNAAEIAEVGLWFWNLKRNKIYSTPMCNKIFELPEGEQLTYEKIISILHPDSQDKIDKILTESKENRSEYNFQAQITHSDGNINWISSQGKTIFNENLDAETLIGSVQIINDAKSASEELERIYNLEKKAKLEAEHANKTKDFFLALVSHELRTPLNSILGWTNILLKKEVDEKTRIKALDTIERSAKSQSKLIEDLVDSARVTSGKLKLELRPLNFYEILENIFNSQLPAIQEKKIQHELKYESKNIEIIGDTIRLRQIFSNLIGNAIKFTPENGKITITQKTVGENVEIMISDTGQGIAKEDFPYIFNRFAQGDENYVKEKTGLGLGLSLARILVEHHNGTISADSKGIGFGATFTVTLPLSSNDSQIVAELDEPVEIENKLDSNVFDRIKLLIVEDNEDSRNVLEIYLNQLGAEIESAESVSEAFKLLNKPDTSLPDVIISDIGMPNEDGYSFLKKIRSSAEYKDIPAIALSAFTAEENKIQAFEAGFQKYHTKPFEPDLLSSEILELLKSTK